MPMDPSNSGDGPPAKLSPESLPLFAEAVHLILYQWTALRLAVDNEWGGRNSRRKFDQIAVDILSWFTPSRDTLYIDDLETMLDEGMILSFNAEIEDGSIEEVAEQLMTVHEEFRQGNFQTLFKLRSSSSQGHGVSKSRQVVDETVDDSADGDDNPCLEMAMDVRMQDETKVAVDGSSVTIPSSEIRIQNGGNSLDKSHNHLSDMSLDLSEQQSRDAEDGWTKVRLKRNQADVKAVTTYYHIHGHPSTPSEFELLTFLY